MALMSSAVGAAALRVFEAEPALHVVTTDFTLAEAKEKLPILIDHHQVDPDEAFELLETLPVTVYAEPDYASHLQAARELIGKRDLKDVALLALALKLGVPVWSNDRHFRDLPVPAYPTAVLLKILDA